MEHFTLHRLYVDHSAGSLLRIQKRPHGKMTIFGPFSTPVCPYPLNLGGAISPPKFWGWSVRSPLFWPGPGRVFRDFLAFGPETPSPKSAGPQLQAQSWHMKSMCTPPKKSKTLNLDGLKRCSAILPKGPNRFLCNFLRRSGFTKFGGFGPFFLHFLPKGPCHIKTLRIVNRYGHSDSLRWRVWRYYFS